MSVTNINEIVIDVLKQQDKPVGIEEIAFRARTSKSIVYEILQRLEKAKIVTQTAVDTYQIDRQNKFSFQEMYR